MCGAERFDRLSSPDFGKVGVWRDPEASLLRQLGTVFLYSSSLSSGACACSLCVVAANDTDTIFIASASGRAVRRISPPWTSFYSLFLAHMMACAFFFFFFCYLRGEATAMRRKEKEKRDLVLSWTELLLQGRTEAKPERTGLREWDRIEPAKKIRGGGEPNCRGGWELDLGD